MIRPRPISEITGHAAEPPRESGVNQTSPRRAGERRGTVGKIVDAVATTFRRAGFAEAAGVSPYPRDEQ